MTWQTAIWNGETPVQAPQETAQPEQAMGTADPDHPAQTKLAV